MTEETASSSVVLVFGFGGGASLSRVDAGAARLAQVALSYDDLTADAADMHSALRPLTEDSIATIACEVGADDGGSNGRSLSLEFGVHRLPLKTKYYEADLELWLYRGEAADSEGAPAGEVSSHISATTAAALGRAALTDAARECEGVMLVLEEGAGGGQEVEFKQMQRVWSAFLEGGLHDPGLRLCVANRSSEENGGVSAGAQAQAQSRIMWCVDEQFEYVETDCTPQGLSGLAAARAEREKDGVARLYEAIESSIWKSMRMLTRARPVTNALDQEEEQAHERKEQQEVEQMQKQKQEEKQKEPQLKQCPKCGYECSTKFCGNCGAKMDLEEEASASASASTTKAGGGKGSADADADAEATGGGDGDGDAHALVLAHCVDLKEQGNGLFRTADYSNACARYEQALGSLVGIPATTATATSTSASASASSGSSSSNSSAGGMSAGELKLACCLNAAACYLKMTTPTKSKSQGTSKDEAVDSEPASTSEGGKETEMEKEKEREWHLRQAVVKASAALSIDAKSVKGLFRRGVAYQQIAQIQMARMEMEASEGKGKGKDGDADGDAGADADRDSEHEYAKYMGLAKSDLSAAVRLDPDNRGARRAYGEVKEAMARRQREKQQEREREREQRASSSNEEENDIKKLAAGAGGGYEELEEVDDMMRTIREVRERAVAQREKEEGGGGGGDGDGDGKGGANGNGNRSGNGSGSGMSDEERRDAAANAAMKLWQLIGGSDDEEDED